MEGGGEAIHTYILYIRSNRETLTFKKKKKSSRKQHTKEYIYVYMRFSSAHLFLISPGGSWLVLLHHGFAQQVQEEADVEVEEEVAGEEEEEEGGRGEEG